MARIGLSQPYYAIYAENAGVVTYSNGASMGKAISLNIEVSEQEDNNLYADNAIAESVSEFAGGTVTVGLDDLALTVAEKLLGLNTEVIATADGDGIVYDNTQAAPYVGMGGVVKQVNSRVTKYLGVILRKVKFHNPGLAVNTQGQNVEWQTPELSGVIMRDDTSTQVWAKYAVFTTEAAAAAWIQTELA